MRIWPVTQIDLTLGLAMAARDASAPRGVGLHMSDIYGSLYCKLDPRRYKGGPISLPHIEAGLALEEMFEEGLKRRLMERPGEFQTPEGIYYNPDGILFDSERADGVVRDMVLGELKATWMTTKDFPVTQAQADASGLLGRFTVNWDGKPSSGTLPPKANKYVTQVACYCYHLGTIHARLYVFFVVGDNAPPGPHILAWDIEFAKQELTEEWTMVRTHAIEEGML